MKGKTNSPSRWDPILNRTNLIIAAGAAIFGVGFAIGQATSSSGVDQIKAELNMILNHILQQNLRIDSLGIVQSQKNVDPKYYVLKDFNEDLDLTCKIGPIYTDIGFITNAFAILGNGVHEYQILIERYVDGKYMYFCASPRRFYEQKEGSNQVPYLMNVFEHKFSKGQKYRLTLRIGSYKNIIKDFICN